MIAFASLLLGLVVGPHPVELLVGDSVAAVEIHLDGRPVGMLSGEPWSLDCDFGTELVPHELLAVAYDDHLEEIARARHRVNLPRRPAEAAIVLEGGTGGHGVAAHLRWESVAGGEPEAVAAWLDGKPLAVDDPRRIPLPAHDPQKLHFLRAELDFAANVTSVLDLVFGGTYADRQAVELTAVPLIVEGGAEPAPAELTGRLSSRGRTLTAVAVEEGPAEVVVVRDEGVRPQLNRLGRTSARVLRQRARAGKGALGAARRRLRYSMTLGGDHQIRFVWPFPRRVIQQGLVAPEKDKALGALHLLYVICNHGCSRRLVFRTKMDVGFRGEKQCICIFSIDPVFLPFECMPQGAQDLILFIPQFSNRNIDRF